MTIVTDLPKENPPVSIQEFIADSPEAANELWAWVSKLHYALVVALAGGAHDLVAIKERFAPVTLWRFEVWLKQNHPNLLFTTTLNQIEEDFPAERTAPRSATPLPCCRGRMSRVARNCSARPPSGYSMRSNR